MKFSTGNFQSRGSCISDSKIFQTKEKFHLRKVVRSTLPLTFPFFAFSLGGEKREKTYGSGNPCRTAAQRQSRQVEWREAPREVYLKNSLLRDFPDSHLPIAKINKNENLVLKIRHFTHFLAAPPLYAVSITPQYRHPAPTSQPRPNPNFSDTIHASLQAQPRPHNPQPPPQSSPRQHKPQPRPQNSLFPTKKNGSAAPPQPWQPDKIKPRSRLQKYAESDSFKLSPLSYRRNSRNPDYTNSIIAVSAPSPRRAPRR